MTATLEGSSEELVEDSLGGLIVDETSWKYQYIGIIVLTNEMSNLLAPCQTGTYTLMLVQSHGDSLATAANADTWINLAALNAFAERMAEVRIVNTRIAVCTVILYRITLFLQIFQYELLQWKTCMVACNTNCLYFHNTLSL